MSRHSTTTLRSTFALGVAVGIGTAIGFGIAAATGAFASLPRPDDPGVPPAMQAADVAPVELNTRVSSTVDDGLRRTAVVEAVERVAPSVVAITTEVPTQDPFSWAYGKRSSTSDGSGVVIDADGVVLTNAHVVERASRITASFADGSSYEAEILGITPDLDLAVLHLRGASGLSSVDIGSSADLMLGEPVIAIGNPFGLGHSVTTGVVSTVSRPLETDERVYQDFIQTDASINPGNSGGPLLNATGDLVGINTAIRADAQGIGFAIPVDRAIKVARDLVDFGEVQVPWLGFDLDDVYVRKRGQRSTAARLERIHTASAAAEAGLEKGDVVTAVDGRAVQGRADLNAYLAGFDPGKAVVLDVLREGRSRPVEIASSKLPDAVVDAAIAKGLGVVLSDGGGRSSGVQVSKIYRGGAFEHYRLQPGDWIVAVNGRRVRNEAELRTAIAKAKSGHRGTALITVARGNASGRFTMPI